MKVHAAVARALADNGVDTLFGLLGDANLFMVDEFVRTQGGRYLGTAHEAGAVLAANGFAHFSGRVGVATVTHGPALTNTVTGLVEGVKAGTPLLLLAGDTPVADKYNLQNIDQAAVVRATGAGFEQMRTAATAPADVSFALWRAATEHRPIVLNMPRDLQWQDVDYEAVGFGPVQSQAITPDPVALDRAVGIVATARRPIVLAGRGALHARPALLRLAERLEAPLATTLQGKDLFRGEPYNLDLFGTLSHEVAIDTIRAADCIVAFGASLNHWTTADGAYTRGKRVIQVDVDPRAIGAYAKIDAAVVGDSSTSADAILSWLDEAEVEPSGARTEDLLNRLSRFRPSAGEDLSTDTTVDLRSAMLAVEAAVPRDRNTVVDGGRFARDAFTLFHAPDPQSFLMTVNYGSIGLGMGNAVGAARARPDRPTLMVAGDGGFMLGGLVEFATACRYDLDIIVVVFNDGSYGAEHIQMRRRGLDPTITMQAWPELAPVADALGGEGTTVRNLTDLEKLGPVIDLRTRPLLIDVKIDPDRVTRE